jgi:hypothetical protein
MYQTNFGEVIIVVSYVLGCTGVNFINIIGTNFSYERRFSSYFLALSKKFVRKTRTYNVDEIDGRAFHGFGEA